MNEITEYQIFISSVYHVELSTIDNNKLYKEFYNIAKHDLGRSLSNIGGYQSEDLNEKKVNINSEIFKLNNEVKNNVKKILKYWNFEEKPSIINSWFNINKKKDFNISHCHPGSLISASYYVKCNDLSGSIVFERPDLEMSYLVPGNTPYNNFFFHFDPKPGDLIIFPSYLRHFVKPNISNEDRVSVAFNLKMQ